MTFVAEGWVFAWAGVRTPAGVLVKLAFLCVKLQRISTLVAEVELGQPLPGRKEMSPGSTQEFFKEKELSFSI